MSVRRRLPHHPHMRIEISVEGVEPPRGCVNDAGGGSQAFVGWLGLLRVLAIALRSSEFVAAGEGSQLRPGRDLELGE